MTSGSLTALVVLLGDYGHHDWGDGWWIVMGTGMLLFWGLVVVGIVWLIRSLRSDGGAATASREQGAVDILDRRLAEGEISVEEYEERRRVLRDSG